MSQQKSANWAPYQQYSMNGRKVGGAKNDLKRVPSNRRYEVIKERSETNSQIKGLQSTQQSNSNTASFGGANMEHRYKRLSAGTRVEGYGNLQSSSSPKGPNNSNPY